MLPVFLRHVFLQDSVVLHPLGWHEKKTKHLWFQGYSLRFAFEWTPTILCQGSRYRGKNEGWAFDQVSTAEDFLEAALILVKRWKRDFITHIFVEGRMEKLNAVVGRDCNGVGRKWKELSAEIDDGWEDEKCWRNKLKKSWFSGKWEWRERRKWNGSFRTQDVKDTEATNNSQHNILNWITFNYSHASRDRFLS